MSRKYSVTLLMLCGTALADAPPVIADNPFVGSWVLQPDETTFSERTLNLLVEHNLYRQTGCGEPIEVLTDGKDQPVSGQPLYDSLAVRVANSHRVEIAEKFAGRLVWKGTYAVSSDQRRMTLAYEDERASNPVGATLEYARVGEPLSGAAGLSGSWRAEKLDKISPTGTTLRIEARDHGLAIAWGDGRKVESDLDTKMNPLAGYLPGAAVSVLQSRPDMLAFNRTQNGRPVEVSRAFVSQDSKTLDYGQVDWLCKGTVRLKYHREP